MTSPTDLADYPGARARRRATLRAAWLFAASLAAWAAGLGLVGYQYRYHPDTQLYDYALEGGVNAPVLATLAALLLARRPQHRITRLFVVLVLAGTVQLLAGAYAHVSLLANGGRWPLGPAAAWLASLGQMLLVVAFIAILWLFPTGQLPGRRWRPAATVACGGLFVTLIVTALAPGPLESGIGRADNPLGTAALAGPLQLLELASLGVVPVVIGGAVLGPLVRFRRSRGVERQQLKWFAASVTVAVLLLLATSTDALPSWAGTVAWTLGPLLVVLAIALAILRYRLYDIDRIISRTVAYGLVTGLLVTVYAGAVVALNTLVPLADDSPVTVAAATLAAAAAFNPLRRRVQADVDRRFNRARYDSARTVEAFGARLRDQVDLDTLTADLLAAVDVTVQPAAAGLWLHPPRAVVR